MKATLLFALTIVVTGVALCFLACIDYADHGTAVRDASVESGAVQQARDACQSRSYRGGARGEIACPGTAKCGCDAPEVCCLATIDAVGGACTALGECRALALSCDGPEDCSDGGACCLEARRGGGSSCKAATECTGEWLCRTDGDCAFAEGGTRCVPLDLGAPGVDDRGLDSIVGTCGR